jgi:hypothetical protein
MTLARIPERMLVDPWIVFRAVTSSGRISAVTSVVANGFQDILS